MISCFLSDRYLNERAFDNFATENYIETWYIEKVLADGTVLRTKVSRAVHKIPKQLGQRILRRQLEVTEEEFWKSL